MFRLVALLCAVMFVALLIAGEDKGQMRPGLASAVAQGEEIVVLERREVPPVVLPEPPPAKAGLSELPPPIQVQPAPAIATYTPEPETPEPAPVFTLSALPGVSAASVIEDPAAAPDPVETAAPDVWYVEASSVNVREAPSADSYVVGKLVAGEAVRVIGDPGAEWVEVAVEGDGLQGYVAGRFLTPDP